MLDYNAVTVYITVKHKPTGETYPAILLDDREDGTIIFQIVGEQAEHAKVFCESDNLEIDTLFETKWERIA